MYSSTADDYRIITVMLMNISLWHVLRLWLSHAEHVVSHACAAFLWLSPADMWCLMHVMRPYADMSLSPT